MAALVVAWPATARAHDPGLSSLELRVEPVRVVATLSLAAADARIAAAGQRGGLESFARGAIELRFDGVMLEEVIEIAAQERDTGARVVLTFPRPAGTRMTIRSTVPSRLARGHRELLTVRALDGRLVTERMLDARDGQVDVDAAAVAASSRGAGQFLALGVRHILGGYDHLLFLAALLLGVSRFSSVVRTVTSFTVAHSITLALAVLGLVRVPGAVVEPLIAASIVFVGIENLVRQPPGSRWKLTFAFGLIHGFGFAGALQDLGVGAGGTVATPLASFNLGVEAGQIAVVVLLWPLICGLRAQDARRPRLAPACSLLVVAAGTYWLLQRTLS